MACGSCSPSALNNRSNRHRFAIRLNSSFRRKKGTMSNPYKAPDSGPANPDIPLGKSPEIIRKTVSLLCLALAVIGFWGATLFTLRNANELISSGYASPLGLAYRLLLPFLLVVATVLFTFKRKISVVALAIYCAWDLLILPKPLNTINALSISTFIALLVYALYLHKKNVLK